MRIPLPIIALALLLWGGGVACAKPVMLHRSPATEQLAANSLRPDIFPAIPAQAIDAGYFPNDLSTSVRTNVTPTTRAGVVEIAAGTYSSSFVHTLANRTIRLMGDVTFEGCAIDIRANDVTVDLNGFTLTFKSVGPASVATATVSTASDPGDSYPTITQTGLTLTNDSHWTFVVQFTSGAENGNHYEVRENSTTVLTLENHSGGAFDTWQNGGPAGGDTFRIYDSRLTAGVLAENRTGIEVVNGSIAEGAGYGRGSSIRSGQGCNPIRLFDCTAMVGGVSITWDADNCSGMRLGDDSIVKYCRIDDQGTVVTNRQRTISAIDLGTNSLIQYCLCVNHRHAFSSSRNDSITEYNEIYGDSRATNAYGLGTINGKRVICRYNNVYKVGEHPIGFALHGIDGGDGPEDCEIYGNWCEAKTTRESTEYGYNFAACVSDRWGERDEANSVHDNCFITYSEDVGPDIEDYRRGKTIFLGAMASTYGDTVGEEFYGNFISAYNTDNETPCHAIGLSLHNDQVVFRDNVIAASHNLFWIGDNYGPGTAGGRFIDNELIKVGSDAAFKTIMANGYWDTNVDFLSNNYGAGTGSGSSDIGQDELGFAALDSDNYFRFGFNLTVTVTDAGSPVSGATVNVKDKDGNTLRSGFTTDGSGQVVVDAPTFYRRGAGFGSTTLSPLTVEAVKDAKDGTNTISPTGDDSISVGIVP